MPLRLLSALAAVALLVGSAVPACAQGFNTFSGRNHPELDWQVAQTEHFRIAYPKRLAGIEAKAAPIAEQTYDALSANLDVTFEDRIRIYLSDEDGIVNGFAVPIGNGYTNIWVNVNDYARAFSGSTKWLRTVLAHELAHLFHYRATRSNIGLFGRLFSDPTPRFWTEGLAQYETERWDAQRGDRWLRAALLADDLSYQDGQSLWNGRLLYAVGNAQTRYLATQHGDSTIADLLAHRDTLLFGAVRVHDFESAFKATTGSSYRDFYDRWRRDANVYYNTLVGQMEALDSLQAVPLDVPGRYVDDVQYSPDTTKVAVLSTRSVERPVRGLYVQDTTGRVRRVAEGAIEAPVAWHPSGGKLAFSRTTRGRHGSLVDDLFLADVDGGGVRRLTRNRRTTAPTFGPAGARLAFAATTNGTTNVFVRDLTAGTERRVTDYRGDVQITGVRWHPRRDTLVYARFGPDGGRHLVLHDLTQGRDTVLTGGRTDDRAPVWHPRGTDLAYTSLRDDVPNVFRYDVATGETRRVTTAARGAAVHDWLPADSAHADGRLVLTNTKNKTRDQVLRIDAAHVPPPDTATVPPAYRAWTTHRPPNTVPRQIDSDPALVTDRSDYRSWANVTHVASLALPYANFDQRGRDYGLAGFTTWTEPLGKHTIAAGGGVSFRAPVERSFFFASYVNNQLYPSLSLSAYRAPTSARTYGRSVLVEDIAAVEAAGTWPLDVAVEPYTNTQLGVRLRYADIQPLNPSRFANPIDGLASPARGQEASLRLTLERQQRPPYRHDHIHPLRGGGARLRVTGAAPIFGADSRYLRGDLSAYRILPSFGPHRLYVYGRVQAQAGRTLPQDYLGFSRFDEVRLGIPDTVPISLGDAERVRGFRSYAVGSRVLFGTIEYRMPLLPSLETEVLGLAALGRTTLAAFADAGAVWRGADWDGGVQRIGVGAEVKNVLRLAGIPLTHALGTARPVGPSGTDRGWQLYYRVQTALPF